MALVRWITEMGMGVDVHGLDYTEAARAGGIRRPTPQQPPLLQRGGKVRIMGGHHRHCKSYFVVRACQARSILRISAG